MNYKEIIESRYNRQNWQLLLRDIFGSKIKFWSTPSIVATSSAFAKQALWLGTITLSDEQTISVYEVELADSVDIERNRRGLRDMLLTTWRNNGNAGAFMFCYRKSESVLRFSYVSEAWKFAEDGSYQKETTDARRFTYLLGEGHRSRTAIQQFERLRDSGLSLKDLTKAFSVDAVSDMFFDGYKKQYEDIIFYITGKRMVKVANKWEERLEGKPCQHIMQQFSRFPNPEKAIRDYVKKLMGRLVFLQFLQKKGWLGVGVHDEWGSGDSEFIQNLFARCNDKDHFIDKVLEPLFNDLNSENEKKLPQYRTPYLNGGLFEQEAADDTDFPLPEKYMKSLLDFFASYNFTIDENDPDDAEVGVDPEMLGRIFENLLEDNKDKGAFYTPKEIVSYMCRESLIAYLQTGIKEETAKEAIRQFVTTHQVQEHLPENTDQLLKDVKICDPAIGSGAFPMGLLKELFLCRTALEGISQHQAAEIKKHIIQQNVYGVDIERGAVDIARLRFWLSLIVDEETPQSLPNLDFKIMQGNSLIESFGGFDLSRIAGKTVGRPSTSTQYVIGLDSDLSQKNLQRLLREYFSVTDHQKKATMRHAINAEVKTLIRESVGGTPTFLAKLEKLDPSANQDFFLWHTWFKDIFDKGGFDLVIGNPPYVNLANLTDDNVRKQYQKNYKTVKNKSDLYSIFTERAHHLLKPRGICSYIFSNSWLGTDSFSLFRKFLVEETRVLKLVDLPDKVFENATVKTCIILFSKDKASSNTIVLENWDGTSFSIMNHSLTYQSIRQYENFPFSFEENIDLSKVNVIKLGEIAHFSLGIKTSNDRRFISNEAFLEDSYRLIRGRNIQRYNTPQSSEWIWYRPDLFMEKVGAGPRQLEFFLTSPKIIIQDIATEICATIDENMYLCNDTINLIYKLNNLYSFNYILGLINSKAVRFWHKKVFPEGLHVKIYQLKEIPIPVVSVTHQKPIIDIVNEIIETKRDNPCADTSVLEKEIDRLVYKLYNLTDEEIAVIDD